MIPKGLKVGDTFTDDGITYQVDKVVGENYESHMVKAGSCGIFNIPVVEKKVIKEIDYTSVPYAQLKKMCAEKGLDATGSKVDLIARLEG